MRMETTALVAIVEPECFDEIEIVAQAAQVVEAGDEKNDEPENENDREGHGVDVLELLVECAAVADGEGEEKRRVECDDVAEEKVGKFLSSFAHGILIYTHCSGFCQTIDNIRAAERKW